MSYSKLFLSTKYSMVLLLELLEPLCNHVFSSFLPLVAVLDDVVEVCVARDNEKCAFLQHLGQRYNAVTEELGFPPLTSHPKGLFPIDRFRSAMHFPQEALVPLPEHVSMLYAVGHVGSLGLALNHDCGLAIYVLLSSLDLVRTSLVLVLVECFLQSLQM